MNNIINKKMNLFILAIIVLIMLCLLFINHYSNRVFVKVDTSLKDVFISDIPDMEDIIADSSITKNNNNLNNVVIDIKINNEYKDEYLVSTSDLVEVEVKNINENYKLYYSLMSEELNTEYKLFDTNFLNNIDTPNKFNLLIKIVVGNNNKVFNIGEFKVYDIVYKHDNNIINANEDVGIIYNDDGTLYTYEDGSEYIYDDIEVNKDIVIDNVTEETIVESNEEKVSLNGNIYLVEETDLNEFDITGHVFIDTEENIEISKNVFDEQDIYSITINNNNFSINNETYYYETIDEVVKITNSNLEEIEVTEIINNSKAKLNESKELVIVKDEVTSSFNLN